MRYWRLFNVTFAVFLPVVYLFSVVGKNGIDVSYDQGSLSVKNDISLDLDEQYELYYEIPSLQYLWNMSFIPQKGYPIAMERWKAVSNNTCLKSSSSKDDESILKWENHKIPHAIVVGCQKCGSTALASFFGSHPNIVTPERELHFLSQYMDRMPTKTSDGIDQRYWKQEYYEYMQWYTEEMEVAKISSGKEDVNIPTNASTRLLIEKTPNYILLSDRVPQRLLCLSPWSKIILLLRNPVDRAFSHYNMAYQGYYRRRKMHDTTPFPSFDEWLRRDYNVLVALGVLSNQSLSSGDPNLGYQGTERERKGWAAYTKLAAIGSIGGIGRGLYSLQILQWKMAYQEAKQPLDMLVLSSDSARKHPQQVFDLICDHLGVARHLLSQETIECGGNKRDYSKIPPMSNSTRQWLESIFEPYNQQLNQVLGKEFWE
ncbi:sulfotransferase [Nitzschia inconspicua]|uniref:Sulfotransferase n=1 Tax=Nitzschia inconspicua TaxID=303405 RepID=A0A9K3PHM8_9STRA|nr:sulfotransferase [Nitzschia inconspicua]